jgi:hypothetical protein
VTSNQRLDKLPPLDSGKETTLSSISSTTDQYLQPLHVCLHLLLLLLLLPPPLRTKSTHHAPALTTTVSLALLHFLHGQFDKDGRELIALPPVAPDADEAARAIPVCRARRLAGCALPLSLLGGMRVREELELERVALVLEELLVDCVRN